MNTRLIVLEFGKLINITITRHSLVVVGYFPDNAVCLCPIIKH